MLEKLLGLGSFDTIVGHLLCCQVNLPVSSMGAKLSLNGSTCYSHLFGMLGFDRSYTSLSFPIGWSPYSSWCNDTCKNWYLSLPGRITRYPCDVIWGRSIICLAFQKFNGAILSSNAIFFDEPTTWVGIYFTSKRCSFGCCASMSSFLCRSSIMGLVINLS
jgi:hypothetical protein